MKNIYWIFIVATFAFACEGPTQKADAYGTIETDEVLVVAQGNGILNHFALEQGQSLKAGEVIGQIDTVQLHIQRREIEAQRVVLQAQQKQISSQIAVLKSEEQNLIREQKRTEKLLKSDASTPQQKEQIDGQLQVLKQKIANVGAQSLTVSANRKALDAKEALLEDQLKKCTIDNPAAGVVTNKFMQEKEMVKIGSPLYKVANLSEVYAWVYISGRQLSTVKIGDAAQVNYDLDNGEMGSLSGRIAYISAKAEFTPKTIQTKEERVDLVYAMKILLQNNGVLKLGMPVEVHFSAKK
ncbi:HlyD family secretion protein [Persicobacter psychrovividus]|uniref:Membrane protein n=1 Tax=Persicobacter psychrovividus TaxID=387638 RepID=A0ABM7VJZ8_9BACT|nr:membrane protein [Persicobacter psychrovividus]